MAIPNFSQKFQVVLKARPKLRTGMAGGKVFLIGQEPSKRSWTRSCQWLRVGATLRKVEILRTIRKKYTDVWTTIAVCTCQPAAQHGATAATNHQGPLRKRSRESYEDRSQAGAHRQDCSRSSRHSARRPVGQVAKGEEYSHKSQQTRVSYAPTRTIIHFVPGTIRRARRSRVELPSGTWGS